MAKVPDYVIEFHGPPHAGKTVALACLYDYLGPINTEKRPKGVILDTPTQPLIAQKETIEQKKDPIPTPNISLQAGDPQRQGETLSFSFDNQGPERWRNRTFAITSFAGEYQPNHPLADRFRDKNHYLIICLNPFACSMTLATAALRGMVTRFQQVPQATQKKQPAAPQFTRFKEALREAAWILFRKDLPLKATDRPRKERVHTQEEEAGADGGRARTARRERAQQQEDESEHEGVAKGTEAPVKPPKIAGVGEEKGLQAGPGSQLLAPGNEVETEPPDSPTVPVTTLPVTHAPEPTGPPSSVAEAPYDQYFQDLAAVPDAYNETEKRETKTTPPDGSPNGVERAVDKLLTSIVRPIVNRTTTSLVILHKAVNELCTPSPESEHGQPAAAGVPSKPPRREILLVLTHADLLTWIPGMDESAFRSVVRSVFGSQTGRLRYSQVLAVRHRNLEFTAGRKQPFQSKPFAPNTGEQLFEAILDQISCRERPEEDPERPTPRPTSPEVIALTREVLSVLRDASKVPPHAPAAEERTTEEGDGRTWRGRVAQAAYHAFVAFPFVALVLLLTCWWVRPAWTPERMLQWAALGLIPLAGYAAWHGWVRGAGWRVRTLENGKKVEFKVTQGWESVPHALHASALGRRLGVGWITPTNAPLGRLPVDDLQTFCHLTNEKPVQPSYPSWIPDVAWLLLGVLLVVSAWVLFPPPPAPAAPAGFTLESDDAKILLPSGSRIAIRVAVKPKDGARGPFLVWGMAEGMDSFVTPVLVKDEETAPKVWVESAPGGKVTGTLSPLVLFARPLDPATAHQILSIRREVEVIPRSEILSLGMSDLNVTAPRGGVRSVVVRTNSLRNSRAPVDLRLYGEAVTSTSVVVPAAMPGGKENPQRLTFQVPPGVIPNPKGYLITVEGTTAWQEGQVTVSTNFTVVVVEPIELKLRSDAFQKNAAGDIPFEVAVGGESKADWWRLEASLNNKPLPKVPDRTASFLIPAKNLAEAGQGEDTLEVRGWVRPAGLGSDLVEIKRLVERIGGRLKTLK